MKYVSSKIETVKCVEANETDLSAIFEFSNRWRYYGTDKFVYKPYNSGGIGGKNSSDW